MKNIINIYKVFIVGALLLLNSCYKEDVDVIPQGDTFGVNLDLSPEFGTQPLTKSTTIATSRELHLNNGYAFVFENDNPQSNGLPDPNGRLRVMTPINDISSAGYETLVLPMIEEKLALIGVANLTQEKLDYLLDIYDRGVEFTYSDFLRESVERVKIKTDANGKTTYADDNTLLINSSSGNLPFSIDPVSLPNGLTASEVNSKTFYTNFSYARIDIMLDPSSTIDLGNVELISARLANVPDAPNYFGNLAINQIDYTDWVHSTSNINTTEQPDAEGNSHLIQGLYLYPNATPTTTAKENQRVSIILKAKTESTILEDGEYFKILVQYTKGSDPSKLYYDIIRDTRYRLQLKNLAGNGYASFEEALVAPPSNVRYDIKVDSDAGNEFVVTNGTSYMALSNTRLDVFGKIEDLTNRDIEAVSIYFDLNDDIEDQLPKPTSNIYATSGIDLVDITDFTENLEQKHLYDIKIRFNESFVAGAQEKITVRTGDLLQEILVRHIDLEDDQTSIDIYKESVTPGSIFAYLDYKSVEDLSSWVLLNGESLLEYNAHSGGGVPIDLIPLTEGLRDNFKSPLYIYNDSGYSTKVLIAQENYEVIDYSDIGTVKSYIGGSMGSDLSVTTLEKDYLSNCYILNPSSTIALKYYIPISTRIKDVWDTYANSSELLPYQGADGKFELPPDWKCKVIWYDSQLIYDSGLVFERDTPNPITGEERISVILPANSQNYGNMLVAVTDADDNILWKWSFWLTAYDPTSIAKTADPANGIGSYTQGGVFKAASSGKIAESALHRYGGSIWSEGVYKNRFIMDRHLGSIDNTLAGCGTLLSADSTKCIAEPISGSGLYQHGNPSPIVGSGALKPDGSSFKYTAKLGYVSVIELNQTPEQFHYGGSGFGQWVTDYDPINAKNVIWYDKNLKYTNDDVYDKAKASKSIFDPSPLGWMINAKETFSDFTSSNLTTDFPISTKRNTAHIYKTFVYLYYTSYRTSGGGGFRLAKESTASNTFDGYIRSNQSDDSSWITNSNSFTANSTGTVRIAVETGKASGLSTRSVSQSEY